ncbi:MAG: GNAT family N-acetyltransferase [Chitinophagaceae bacterium]
METVQISKVTAAELSELELISKQTFLETFAHLNSEKNMSQYLDESFSQSNLALEIADENSAFYFARSGGQLMGYLKVNTGAAQTELLDIDALEIERIYVSKDHQGKKIGQLFFNHAMDLAKKKDVSYVWLGVWEHNTNAISFYEKNGFAAFSSHVFKLGDDEQTDIMMKKALK